MSNSLKPNQLGAALQETMGLYHKDVTERVNACSAAAVKSLVKKTKATAPVGKRGSFKKNITSRQSKKSPNGNTYAWCVKAPDYRLTHLLVKGHATKDGGRTKPDPFLKNALDEVLPEYEDNVKEVLQE